MSPNAATYLGAGAGVATAITVALLPDKALAVPVVGAVFTAAAGAGVTWMGVRTVYQHSSRVRELVDGLTAQADLLLNPPRARRALPGPSDPRDLLAAFLAEEMPAPSPPASTGQLVRVATMEPLTVARQVVRPALPTVVVTYHPELLSRWSEHATASDLASALRLAGDIDTAVVTLCYELGAYQARVAASDGTGRGPALAFIMTDGTLSSNQQAALAGVPWWQPYRSGRLQGVLVLLGSLPKAAVTTRMAAVSMVAPVGSESFYPDADDDDTPELLAETAAPELPVIEFATRLGHREALPAPAARQGVPARPRMPSPLVPTARLVGSGAIPGVEITTAYDRAGNWIYRPLKHGMIAVSTGAGKTNSLDLILGQIQALGSVDVWYGTAKPFVMIDPTDRLDRRPLIANLPPAQLALDEDKILSWIWQATEHMNQQYRRMQAEPGWFPRPTVLVFDELKNYLTTMKQRELKAKLGSREVYIHKLVAGCVSDWLTKAREAGGSIIFTSQDGYCGSVELTRGEMLNLGYRQVHPSLDQNSLRNVLPEGAPEVFNPGAHDWFFAGGGRPVELGTVPRVSVDMFRAWGLLAEEGQGSSDSNPANGAAGATVDDATLLRWVLAEGRAGRTVTVERTAAEFGLTVAAMRAQMVRNELLEG